MNRREFVTTLAAGAVPLINDEWRDQIWNTVDSPSSSEQTYLRDFLVPEAALDDAYVPVEIDVPEAKRHVVEPPVEPGLRERTITSPVDWADEPIQRLQYKVASKEYEIPIEPDDIEIDSEASLTTKAGQPAGIDEPIGTPADLHRKWHNEWWGATAEPIADYASEWVETHAEERDEPHRWTEYCVRQPVLYLDPELMAAAGSRRPYFEETLIIATTKWGVISLQSKLLTFSDETETLDTVRALAKELYQQTRNAPTPTLD